MSLNLLIARTLGKLLKRLRVLGHVRFRIIRYFYKIFEPTNSRNGEWDFVLQYLPDVRWLHYNPKLRVLDVGAVESLLIYELDKRGYAVCGIDQRPYQEPLPPQISFGQRDITKTLIFPTLNGVQKKFEYIVAVSTIEHIGLQGYGEKEPIPNGDRIAVENIHKMLMDTGYFIITVPIEFWATNSGRGYSAKSFYELIDGLFSVYEITQRNNQICAVLIKK